MTTATYWMNWLNLTFFKWINWENSGSNKLRTLAPVSPYNSQTLRSWEYKKRSPIKGPLDCQKNSPYEVNKKMYRKIVWRICTLMLGCKSFKKEEFFNYIFCTKVSITQQQICSTWLTIRYAGSFPCLCANIKKTRVVLRQLTFSWEKRKTNDDWQVCYQSCSIHNSRCLSSKNSKASQHKYDQGKIELYKQFSL